VEKPVPKKKKVACVVEVADGKDKVAWEACRKYVTLSLFFPHSPNTFLDVIS
jgi:hypothetical protein